MKKNVILTLRVTPAEAENLNMQAIRSGTSRSDFMRDKLNEDYSSPEANSKLISKNTQGNGQSTYKIRDLPLYNAAAQKIPGITGFFIYISNPTTTRLIIGIGITLIGLVAGIIFATKIWKKKGTINFISRVSASPELDNIEKTDE